MVKVTLVNPGYRLEHDQPALGLIQLAAYIRREGHDVRIVNRQLCESLETNMKDFNPDVVGITAMTATVNDAYRCADYCKRLGKYVVMGGVHVSVLPEEAKEHCNAVVVGEGEKKFTELIESKEDGVFHGTQIENLDDLPLPAYDLINMDYYTNIRMIRKDPISILTFVPVNFKIGCLLTSRGCPFNCIFCYNSTRDSKVRYSSPEKVLETMMHLVDTYNIKAACFVEDHFFMNKDRVKRILELFNRNDIKVMWSGNSRADGVSDSVLEEANSNGCVQIAFGFESGSQTILNVMNKGTTVEDNVNAVKLCDKHNIICQGNFMVGNLNEELSDIMQTCRFIENNNVDGGIGVSICTPLPGTKLWKLFPFDPIAVRKEYDKLSYNKTPFNLTMVKSTEMEKAIRLVTGVAHANFFSRAPSRLKKVNLMTNRLFNSEVTVKDDVLYG